MLRPFFARLAVWIFHRQEAKEPRGASYLSRVSGAFRAVGARFARMKAHNGLPGVAARCDPSWLLGFLASWR